MSELIVIHKNISRKGEIYIVSGKNGPPKHLQITL